MDASIEQRLRDVAAEDSEAEDRYYASLADEEDYRKWRWERHVANERQFRDEVGERRALHGFYGMARIQYLGWPEGGIQVTDEDFTPSAL